MKAMLKVLCLDLTRSVGLYVLVVVGGTVCFLSLAPVVGYLPYSDRPGPGWFSGGFPAIGWGDFWRTVWFMLGWSLLLAPYAVVAALMVLAIVRLLELFRTPRLAVALVGALVAGFVSGYLVLAFGWYIAIAAAPVYFAMALGLVFGGLMLPRLSARTRVPRLNRSVMRRELDRPKEG